MAFTHVRLIFLLACTLTWASCTPSKGADEPPVGVKKPLAAADTQAYRQCERDDQCTWVNNGCCDCSNGGEDVAVATDKKDAFRALFSCDNTPCTEVDVQPPCGTGTVACEAGLCVFHESTP